MTAPMRIQLSRRKGFALQTVSRALNGLYAAKVDRSTKYGNPVRLDDWQDAFQAVLGFGEAGNARGRHAAAVKAFELLLTAQRKPVDPATLTPWQREVFTLKLDRDPPSMEDVRELRGHNLACWCKLCPAHAAGKPFDVECSDCAPCHADCLGVLANTEPQP